MEHGKYNIPVLISILVICVTAFSLISYEAPTFAAPAEAQTQAAAPKLMKKADTSGAVKQKLDPRGSRSLSKVKDPGDYADGTWYGSATGFRGTIKVKVTIRNGKISKIGVVSHSDDASYFNRAKSVLGKIIGSQSTNVDTVSGATYSSVGLIKAVRNALNKAAKANKKDKKKKKDKDGQDKSGRFPYPDGTYQGTAEGYCSDITVAVTIKNKTITGIEVVSQDEDEEFFSMALKVLKKIVKAQKTDVDTVSGATYSSRGLINATINALMEAEAERPEETNPTDSTEATDPTESQAEYADGTYTIEVTCSPDDDLEFDEYTLYVDVAIKDGVISDISNARSNGGKGNKSFIKCALDGLKKSIPGKNDVSGIDTISGATCTSVSIIEACRLALDAAKQ